MPEPSMKVYAGQSVESHIELSDEEMLAEDVGKEASFSLVLALDEDWVAGKPTQYKEVTQTYRFKMQMTKERHSQTLLQAAPRRRPWTMTRHGVAQRSQGSGPLARGAQATAAAAGSRSPVRTAPPMAEAPTGATGSQSQCLSQPVERGKAS